MIGFIGMRRRGTGGRSSSFNGARRRAVAVEALEGRVFLSAGDPDPTFGPGGLGRVTTDFGFPDEQAKAVVALPGGKFVLVGQTAPNEADLALARYNADGSLDTTFGRGGADGDGKVVKDVGRADWPAGAAAGPNGTLLVALTQDPFADSGPEVQNFVLLRYRADGTLDPTFGRGGADGDGVVTTNFGDIAEFAFCNAMAVQPDGRIVLTGRLADTRTRTQQAVVVRYLPDGTLDRTFGAGGADGDGRVTVNPGAGASGAAVAVAPDGKIVVGGGVSRADDSWPHALVLRLNPDGTPDRTFGGGDGAVEVPSLGLISDVRDLAVLPGGRVVATGNHGSWSYLLRLTPAGALDGGFGNGTGPEPGITLFEATASALAVAGDGKFVVAAWDARNNFEPDPGVAFFRFDAGGRPDAAFGRGGRSVVRLDPDPEKAFGLPNDVVVLPDGRVLAAGLARFRSADGSQPGDFLAVRLQADGGDGDGDDQVAEAIATSVGATVRGQRISPGIDVDLYRFTASAGQRVAFDVDLPAGSALDPYLRLFDAQGNVLAFNDDAAAPGEAAGREGFITYRFPAAGTYYVGVSASANNAYDAVGGGHDGAGPGGAYTLSLTDRTAPPAGGDLDLSFGQRGRTVTPFDTPASAAAVAATADGGAVVAGTSAGRFALTKYRADGSLDPAFGGGDGIVLTNFGTGTESAAGVVVQPDGRIVVAGVANGHMAVARYNANGSLDTSFGRGGAEGDGRVIINFGAPSEAASVALAPGGRIAVAGRRLTPSEEDGTIEDLAVARLNAGGTLDATFGAGGKVVTGTFRYQGGYVAVRPDGRVVVAGTGFNQVDRGQWVGSVEVIGYSANGSIDTSFGGGDGVVGESFIADNGGFADDSARAVTLLPDGRIVVAGEGPAGPGVMRLLPDGSLDTTFDGDGRAVPPVGLAALGGFKAVAPAAGGKLLVAANVQSPADAATGGLSRDVLVMRLDADGSVDHTFEGDGRPVTVDFGGQDTLAGIAVGTAGNVFAAATSDDRFALASLRGDNAGTVPAVQTYQAEAATVVGAAITRTHPGYSGSGYVDFANASGDSIEWTVNAPAAGLYLLQFHYANGSNNTRPTELRVNGVIATRGAGGLGLEFPPTGSWSMWSVAAVHVTLNAGANKVRLATWGFNGANIDSLAVSPAAAQSFQAEDATISGAVVSTAHGGYTGRGYVDYQHATGDFIEWVIDAPAAGGYAARFRYANGSGGSRSLGLSFNGTLAPGGVTFAPTGSWSTWGTAEARVELIAGRNVIRLFATGSSGPNLDSLLLEPLSA